MRSKVSVIVPVYNIEKYVEGCIKSLISQTYNNLEIILVNDGSADNSLKICLDFSRIDRRIKIVNKDNGGQSSARNAGIDAATGEYIMFVDGDDYIAVNTVEVLMKCINKYSSDIVQFDYVETNNEYKTQVANEPTEFVLLNDMYKMFERLYNVGGSIASPCTKLYNKKLFESIRFREGMIYEDEYLITYILQSAKTILYIDFKPYYYLIRPGSTINSVFSKKKLDIFVVNKDRKEQLYKLGFDELVIIQNNRFFTSLLLLWCESKAIKDKENNIAITNELKSFLKKEKVNLSFKFNIIYKLCKLNYRFVYLYYVYKKLSNQV